MKKILKKIIFGITLPQEYLCVKQNEFLKALKVFAYDKSSEFSFDITSHHLFLGYKPLVIAVDKKYLSE